ncbi:hypothetical protein ERO13_A13G076800v2 [Gossypium hirsutum]|uniref:Uncharacterized protein n=3 Tax=Gossypium TaxID=3633 RepID=A0A5J5SWF0_GOSBA|nr:hypothetical protein ES319_A13G082100v1 [Gossypium barbadense]KAG4165402.1 hypothetical protein ERO13_A13G076800v2 [Gossypium hirsutum]TYG85828.1 hypothetical protein ES288_A13G086200v1 [Gossypium darwinii]TYJ00413.1 hypothetical protein E1A91_A13G085000v1 [Gossypium mustelinum]
MVYEILDNAVDEAQAGFATQIDVVLHSDGSVSITDNGCGPIGASSEGKTDVMKKIRFHRWSRNLLVKLFKDKQRGSTTLSHKRNFGKGK